MSFSSERVLIFRNRAGFSQAELAQLVGVDTFDIINYENGTEEPRMDVLAKISVACGVSLDEMLYDQNCDEASETPSIMKAVTGTYIINDVPLIDILSFDKKKEEVEEEEKKPKKKLKKKKKSKPR